MKLETIKPWLLLFGLFLLTYIAPEKSLDPWNLINSKKIITIITALTLIQVIGNVLVSKLGPKLGSALIGFLGGFISSTAITAGVARQSNRANAKANFEVFILITATLAMLIEALMIVALGGKLTDHRLLLLFLGPIVASVLLLVILFRTKSKEVIEQKSSKVDIKSTLLLTLFIVCILAVSKLLQHQFGEKGLLVLTFLVSLFEIHGSMIANVQLFASDAIGIKTFGNLVTTSLLASYVSKFFLIYTLGSKKLCRITTLYFGFILTSLLLSWVIFFFALT